MQPNSKKIVASQAAIHPGPKAPSFPRRDVNSYPFTEQIINNQLHIRTFLDNVLDHELTWHRDRQSRRITVIESNGWQFQHDNCLPIIMKIGDCITVPANSWHRIIKGIGNLKLQVFEF